jgi:hypothetical protein
MVKSFVPWARERIGSFFLGTERFREQGRETWFRCAQSHPRSSLSFSAAGSLTSGNYKNGSLAATISPALCFAFDPVIHHKFTRS